MTEEDQTPPSRRRVPTSVLLAGLTMLPALLVAFGGALSAAGGYVCGVMIAALSRKYGDPFDASLAPEIGAAIGVVFFVCAFIYQYLTRKR
ncbi:hypothetical protein RBA41_23845 [Massilia sp. CCM 9210]|uniref:hypothetical protein n=1 Tax=Massilia scottii TaxID=3057166 RepID=UPI0027966F8D|nr:hypothetical protein [Massilia sp. CCM 9210]MDQ1816334.1 hypothetical protein [Massilia sp. CCM 9210]